MKSIAFAIVTASALAWGVSVQAAPNGTAGALNGAERQSSTQLIQHEQSTSAPSALPSRVPLARRASALPPGMRAWAWSGQRASQRRRRPFRLFHSVFPSFNATA